jgi:tetratricopeptide (TPR) repeat protein
MTARKRAGGRRVREAQAGRPRGPAAPRLLLLSIALAFALRAAASLLPIPGVWGLDTLRVWPLGPAVALLLLGAIGFVPVVARGMERAMELLGSLGDRASYSVDAALGVCAGLALYNLRDPVRWVGDLMTRVGQLTLDAPIAKVFPQAAPLDRWVNIVIPRHIIRPGTEVTTALQLVGAVVGGLFTIAALRYLRAAGASRATQAASAALVLGGGYMLHFAGYDKFGPLLIGMVLAAWGVVRLAREGRGAWAVGAGMVVCLLSHRSGFLLVPAAVWALAQGIRHAPERRARIEALAAALAILVAAGFMLPKALHLLETIDRAQNLEGPRVAGGSLLIRLLADAAARSSDAINVLFLLVPLWPAGLAVAWLARRGDAAKEQKPATRTTSVVAEGKPAPAPVPVAAARAGQPARDDAARFPLEPVALLAVAPEVALLLVARGAQGAARDWDMHVGAALVIALATAAGLLAIWRRMGAAGSLAPLTTTALASAIALWGTHVSEPLQLARIQQQLSDRGAWTDGAWARAHDFIGVRALQQQRPEDAIRALEAAAAVAPNPRFFFQIGLAQRMLMRFDDARASFEKAHRLDPKLADAWVGFALLAYDARDWRRVEACAESALVYAPHRKDAKEIRTKAQQAIEAGR